MHTIRHRGIALCLILALLVLGGCAFNPWIQPPIIVIPVNLIEDPKADNGGVGWHFSSPDAYISGTGDPAFTVRNDASIQQTVDLRDTPGSFIVLMAFSATETISPSGMGRVHGQVLDVNDPLLIIADLVSPDLESHSVTPNQWVVLADCFPMPPGAGLVEIFLENTEDPLVPFDGSNTWFDDIELWVMETEQDAIDLINAYIVAHP